MTDPGKSHCCNADIWDLDCGVFRSTGWADNEEDDCPECDGLGYIDGWHECSECGETWEE